MPCNPQVQLEISPGQRAFSSQFGTSPDYTPYEANEYALPGIECYPSHYFAFPELRSHCDRRNEIPHEPARFELRPSEIKATTAGVLCRRSLLVSRSGATSLPSRLLEENGNGRL